MNNESNVNLFGCTFILGYTCTAAALGATLAWTASHALHMPQFAGVSAVVGAVVFAVAAALGLAAVLNQHR